MRSHGGAHRTRGRRQSHHRRAHARNSRRRRRKCGGGEDARRSNHDGGPLRVRHARGRVEIKTSRRLESDAVFQAVERARRHPCHQRAPLVRPQVAPVRRSCVQSLAVAQRVRGHVRMLRRI